MLAPAIDAMRQRLPIPTRIEAAAILRAWEERAVPLPLQEAAEWYAPGGDYWRLRWAVCGWQREGDKFLASTALGWGLPLSAREAADFWATMDVLATESDQWQLAQGADVSPPLVDVAALLRRTEKPIWEKVTSIGPIWTWNDKAPRNLAKFITDSWEKLKEWRRKRQADPTRPVLPPPLPSLPSAGAAGLFIILGVAIILGTTTRRPTRTRNRTRR